MMMLLQSIQTQQKFVMVFDNDCDGLSDDDDDSVDGTYTTYTDGDGDGYGDASTELMSCT